MSRLFGSQRRDVGDTVNNLVPPRVSSHGVKIPSVSRSMQHSVVWSCLDLRASIISSLPASQYRMVGDLKATMPASQLLTNPGALHVGGPLARFDEWMYAKEMDLGRFGNAFGLIQAWDGGWGVPTRIDLVPAEHVTVRVRKGVVSYMIDGKEFSSTEVWHERDHVVPGTPIGLEPIGAAAFALATHVTAQEFAAAWFQSGGIPSAVVQKKKGDPTDTEALAVKNRLKSTLAAGDVLVMGSSWEYNMVAVPNSQASFLQTMQASELEIVRFFSTPAAMVDVPIVGSAVTYANITQKNLDYLTIHLGPVISRREAALGAALPGPHNVELDPKALLRLDPQSVATMNALKVDKRALTPDEWRAQEDKAPLTPDQMDLFNILFNKTVPGIPAPIGGSDVAAQ